MSLDVWLALLVGQSPNTSDVSDEGLRFLVWFVWIAAAIWIVGAWPIGLVSGILFAALTWITWAPFIGSFFSDERGK